MPPKAKGKAAAKVKARAKPKARLAMRIRPAHGGVLRRPAGLHRDESAPVPRERWGRGLTVQGADVPVAELAKGVELVIDEGSYFGAACRVAGTIRGLEVEREATHVLLQATGTDLESLLKHCTGAPGEHLRGHLCGPTCSGDRVAEDLIHIKKVRQSRGHEEEEHWCRNLVAVERPAGDDLKDLREKRDELKEAKEKDKSRSRRRERSKKRKKKEKERDASPGGRKKMKERSRSPSMKRSKKEHAKGSKEDKVAKVGSSSSSPVIQTDGTMPRAASSKSLQALFAGTGLDVKEKPDAEWPDVPSGWCGERNRTGEKAAAGAPHPTTTRRSTLLRRRASSKGLRRSKGSQTVALGLSGRGPWQT